MSDFFERVRKDLPTIRGIINDPQKDPMVKALLRAHQALLSVESWVDAVEQNWPDDEAAPSLENGTAAVAEATEIVKTKAK